MKLQATPHSVFHTVTAYGPDHVAVDGRMLRRSFLLMPESLDENWGPTAFALLDTAHLTSLAMLACDVLLLGTGARQQFPLPNLLRPLIEAGRPIEIMDTQAACRTYNILVAEGRMVAAALIIEAPAAL